MKDAFALQRSFWVQLGWGLIVSLLSAFGALLFKILFAS